MADHQRVHPTTEDVEKTAGENENENQSSPLVRKPSLSSDKDELSSPSSRQMRVQFPRDQVFDFPIREIPRYYSRPPKRRKSCCRCLCCTICFLFALVATIAIVCGILYWVFQPKIPKYSVDSIHITNLSINSDLSTNCQFSVNVTAWNPNKKIGIYYLDNSHLAVLYSGVELCTGALPAFYQGHKNTTFLPVALSATGARLTTDMVSALNKQQQQDSIPLNLKANVPVKIKLGKLKLMKIKVRVRWDLVVDKLDVSAKVTSEKTKVRVAL